MRIALSRRVATAAFLAFVLLVVLRATGAFRSGLVEPGRTQPPEGLPAPARTAVATRRSVAVHDEAVGTVGSRRRVAVASQVMARVLEVRAEVGGPVRRGDLLVVLDEREPAARLARARDAVAAAEAARAQAGQSKVRAEAAQARDRAAHERERGLFAKGVVTAEELEDAESRRLQSEASVAEAAAAVSLAAAQIEQARQAAAEAEIALGHCRIAAPLDAVVFERAAEPGDLAVPGNPLLVLLDPAALRLEAQVREGLIGRVAPGARLPVALPAAGRIVEGTVAEVVPAADPRSRSFEVRVDFEPVDGARPGMFGRLRFPVGSREVVAVPAASVTRVGQLRTVAVREEGGSWARRLVTLGADLGEGLVEVLSGLSGGETVGIP